MQRWDYLTVRLDHFGAMAPQQLAPRFVNGQELKDWKKISVSAFLSQLGQDGWEMCGMLNTQRDENCLFFKRPKP